MFKTARIKLTLLFTAVFLACFWAFSYGLYSWTERSFEVEVGEQSHRIEAPPGVDLGEVIIDINEKALDQLAHILIVFNALLLGIVPALSWWLTGKALEPVRRSHEAQRQFVSDAAHELRTPLTIVQSELEVALTKPRSPPEYRAVLKSSQQEVARLSSLTEHLLLLARHDDGKAIAKFEQLDLTDLVSKVLAAHRSAIKNKALKLAFNPPEMNLEVKGDPLTLPSLFNNIVDNAVKYTPSGGAISVTIKQQDANAIVEIADTGIGIAPDFQGKIFDRFTRADISRGETKGFGLGLAICRSIAESHNGTISVVSSPGQGSTFAVVLPRA